MQRCALGRAREWPIFLRRETKGPKSMPILPFPPRKPIAATLEPYFTAEPVSSARRLRPLSALEQMYAYWGSDRA